MSGFLSEETRQFLGGGVSIMVASRNAQLIPSIVRAKGCVIVSAPTPKLRIFVSNIQAADLVDDIRLSRMVSVTFSVPSTHRTLQFKGRDAAIGPLRDGERDVITRYVDTFVASIEPLGFSEDFTRAFFASPPDEVAIEFTPAEIYQQTPGPTAGARLS